MSHFPGIKSVSLEIDLMAGWIPTKSFSPPLRIQLDGTTLIQTPSHIKSQYPTYRPLKQLGRDKNWLEATSYHSPKIGDRWHLSRVNFHSHWKTINMLTTSWTNSPKLVQLATRARWPGAGCNKESVESQPIPAGNLEDNFLKVHRTSNPTGFSNFRSKLRIRDRCELLRCLYVKL